MKAILAANKLGFIGFEDKIPRKSKEDFYHFRKLTTQPSIFGNMVPKLLVGRTTLKKCHYWNIENYM